MPFSKAQDQQKRPDISRVNVVSFHRRLNDSSTGRCSFHKLHSLMHTGTVHFSHRSIERGSLVALWAPFLETATYNMPIRRGRQEPKLSIGPEEVSPNPRSYTEAPCNATCILSNAEGDDVRIAATS